ncbi:MAG TPA: hypothetical protein ENH82_05625, partial [bacterium]|nr:hypothetical protein [bacterium]
MTILNISKNSLIFCCMLCSYVTPILAAAGNLIWKMPTTGNYISSSPSIGHDGTIYFGSSNHNLYAVHPNGKKKWQYHTNGEIDDSPSISRNGTIYFGSFDTYFYALSPEGKLLWRYKTGDLIRSTPAIAVDGTIVFGSYDGYLYALNPDGTLKWKYKAGGKIASSPLISLDGNIYFGARDWNVYALTSYGELMWKYKTGGIIHWSSPAAGYDGVLYIGSFDGNLYVINPDGTLRWKYKTGGNIGSSPALGKDGTVYFESCDSYFYALSVDGTLKWKYDVQNTELGCHPVIGKDGTIYVGSDDGHFYALNPDGILKWKYETKGSLLTTGATIDDNGIIYFVSADGNFYAVDTGTNTGIADTPWPKFHRDARNSGKMELFSISPPHLIIRDVAAGETKEKILVVRNYDTEPLNIEHITVNNDRFAISPNSTVIMPSDSILITVSFSPVSMDEQQAVSILHIDSREIPVYITGNPLSEPKQVPVRLITRDGETGELMPCRIFLEDSHGRFILPQMSESLQNKMFFVSPGDIEFFVFTGEYNMSIARGNEYIPIHNEIIRIQANEQEICTIERTLHRWIHMK